MDLISKFVPPHLDPASVDAVSAGLAGCGLMWMWASLGEVGRTVSETTIMPRRPR